MDTREWLETNGLGGFASSTVIGMNTRRYHGLLVAATKPPVGRTVLLSKLEEVLTIDGRKYELSVNEYPGVVHPQGHLLLQSFRRDPFPIFTYAVEGIELEKRVFLVHGENTVVIEYEVRIPDLKQVSECRLDVRPLIAFRDFHSTTHENDSLNSAIGEDDRCVSVHPYNGMPVLYFAHDAAAVQKEGVWYRNFEYVMEKERGLDFREDLFNPLRLEFDLLANTRAAVIASTQQHRAEEAPTLRDREIARREAVVARSPRQEPIVRALTAAADQFIVKRGDLKTVIAGYHWFGDWGRDTMIALPGLTLYTGNTDVAKEILKAFAQHVNQGMLPNWFPDGGDQPEYNTVDATLWFFEAVRALGDYAFIREYLYDTLKSILDWHISGTRYGIRLDDDGLLAAGEEGVQLTWMDAKVGDYVVTPRRGKPVEIQALWYNALCTMSDLATRFGDEDSALITGELAKLASKNFNRKFWNDETDCLEDVLGDPTIRPNQIFAVSLRHSMLSPERARRVVDVVQRELWTPAGLRSLSPSDPQYRPRYEGDVWSRDTAYHQGTVWPWLMGPFLTAYVKVHGPGARAQAAEWLNGFASQMDSACLGQISEIADAEAPFTPRGCVAQAWSVAELLRAAVEDVFVEQSLQRSA